jgi:hypothetical protein
LIIKRTTAYNVEIPGPYLGETLKYGEVQHNYVIQPPVGNGISKGIAQMRKKNLHGIYFTQKSHILSQK